ncbi:MAG: RluA family pseudouridine synthase [Planctomycetota bacterium]
MKVLFEDNHLLAVLKPPGLPTMGAGPGVPTLLDQAKAHIREKYNKPGNVYLGIVSRLDAPVTGVVLMARTSKAAARLSEAFRGRSVDKSYLAAIEGVPDQDTATLVHHLRKDDRHRKVHVTTPDAADAQRAELSYEVLGDGPRGALLLVKLVTGRKHQIRVQLAKLGCPIVGDRKYGAQTSLPAGIALHAWRLALEHPVRRERLTITAPTPPAWSRFWPLSEARLPA